MQHFAFASIGKVAWIDGISDMSLAHSSSLRAIPDLLGQI